jgi:uncharacterized protein (TIGR02246 family)
MTPTDVVLHFLERINQHDADQVAELMTEDHVFIDSLGNVIRGRDHMRSGWRSYYALCPDYRVSHEQIFAHGNRVALFGTAAGTIATGQELLASNRWQTPAAWLALVENQMVKEWRVYADNKPVYDIISGSKLIRRQ